MIVAERLPPLDPDAADEALLARRLRIAIALCVVPILLFALFDLALLPREQLPLYWSLKVAALLLICTSAVLLRQGARRQPHTRTRLGLLNGPTLFAYSRTSSPTV